VLPCSAAVLSSLAEFGHISLFKKQKVHYLEIIQIVLALKGVVGSLASASFETNMIVHQEQDMIMINVGNTQIKA
jgi:hypothetical protein